MSLPSLERVASDPCTSYWLRQAIVDCTRRDPVDAARDAEVLARLMRERVKALLEG